ncbi:MAG TPA: helix-turn-helix domain-containing protein [Methanoregulaceae archaeon]|nr:helix-turn-helix domain-containing protein [Methanoregulaceae archaeon]
MLENGDQLTQKDIVRETLLPSRTVRYALGRLKEERILVKRHDFTDARQSLYTLNRQDQEVAPV